MSRMVPITLENCMRSLTTRITKINVSLESLKDKRGQYADEHRALLTAHEEAREIYRAHLDKYRLHVESEP